jgi:hypothetical protein
MAKREETTTTWICDRCGVGVIGNGYDYPDGWARILLRQEQADLCVVCIEAYYRWLKTER